MTCVYEYDVGTAQQSSEWNFKTEPSRKNQNSLEVIPATNYNTNGWKNPSVRVKLDQILF